MPPTSEDSEQHSVIHHEEDIDNGSNDSLDIIREANNNSSGEDEYVFTLSNELKQLAEDDLDESPQVRDESLQSLRSWIKSQPHLRGCRLDANFLLRFLRMQKHNVINSSLVLEKYLTMRVQHPNWFQNLDIRDPAIYELVTNGYLFVLPERDTFGRKVIFSVAKNLDPTRHTNSDAMRAHLITFEALLEDEESQIRGFSYIFDCQGLSLGHLGIWTPSEVAKMFSCCEKNLPMRHRQINLLSLPFGIWAVFEFAKSLLSDKIRKRFCVHGDITKLQKSLEDHSFLPEEYGGQIPLKQQAQQWAHHLEEIRPRLLALDTMKVEVKTDGKEQNRRKSSFLGWFYKPAE